MDCVENNGPQNLVPLTGEEAIPLFRAGLIQLSASLTPDGVEVLESLRKIPKRENERRKAI